MLEDLHWLGLDWDEGPEVSGPQEPYYQSERTALYEAALQKLAEQDLVYPCFCTRAELHAASAPHREDGQVLYADLPESDCGTDCRKKLSPCAGPAAAGSG
jgi:glutamyl-tRNA synthetase